ncbi:50S ribosomal protein P1 [Candidatus Micrarchaeota archaeon]|nr:50S ribosomal protein P1 [Candidatus Micrarchaeota archaeon]MBD3418391.1 50S ribosomal protein P1 [Candidatus Micrarchaeota archaeon]
MAKVDPYLHAVLVLHGSGKDVSQEGIVAVMKAAGAEADEAKAKVLSEAVKGVDFEDLLKNVATVAAAPAAAPAAPAAGGEEKKEEEGEEEPTEEKKEEQAAEGLANLFG